MASEYSGFLTDGADYQFPLASDRIADFMELLSTGLLLNAWESAEEGPTGAAIAAAERTAEEIVDALVYGVPPKLAAFLGAGQPPETVKQINGWLAMVLGRPSFHEELAKVERQRADDDFNEALGCD